jgi:drug/metabolite transporter (DMT)-like permease
MQIRGERAATACGLMAILLWSTALGLIRSVSEHFGPLAGGAMIYSLGAIFLIILLGRPKLRSSSRF